MVALHGVGCVNKLSDGLIVLEELAQTVPVVTPGLDDYWILFTSLFLKSIKSHLARFLGCGTINRLKILHKLLLILAADILH